MLVDQRLRFGAALMLALAHAKLPSLYRGGGNLLVQVNSESIVVVASVRVTGVPKLPVHIAHLLLQARLLEQRQNLDSSCVIGEAEVLETCLVCKPSCSNR